MPLSVHLERQRQGALPQPPGHLWPWGRGALTAQQAQQQGLPVPVQACYWPGSSHLCRTPTQSRQSWIHLRLMRKLQHPQQQRSQVQVPGLQQLLVLLAGPAAPLPRYRTLHPRWMMWVLLRMTMVVLLPTEHLELHGQNPSVFQLAPTQPSTKSVSGKALLPLERRFCALQSAEYTHKRFPGQAGALTVPFWAGVAKAAAGGPATHHQSSSAPSRPGRIRGKAVRGGAEAHAYYTLWAPIPSRLRNCVLSWHSCDVSTCPLLASEHCQWLVMQEGSPH